MHKMLSHSVNLNTNWKKQYVVECVEKLGVSEEFPEIFRCSCLQKCSNY